MDLGGYNQNGRKKFTENDRTWMIIVPSNITTIALYIDDWHSEGKYLLVRILIEGKCVELI